MHECVWVNFLGYKIIIEYIILKLLFCTNKLIQIHLHINIITNIQDILEKVVHMTVFMCT